MMKRKLLRIFSAILCVCMLLACQIYAGNSGERGIMPLWDNVGGALCEISFTEFGVGYVTGSVSSRYAGGIVYVKLTLYRVRFLLSDVVVDFWAASDYDSVVIGETFTPSDGQKYKLVLEATVTYDGYEEPITLSDTETYYASSNP